MLCAALPAAAQSEPPTRITFGPATPNETVTYRFSATMSRPRGAQSGAPQGAPPADGPPAPPAQTVSFTMLDATHVKLATTGDGAPQTLVAERTADGLLQAKLPRGSYWGMTIQLYNRLALATSPHPRSSWEPQKRATFPPRRAATNSMERWRCRAIRKTCKLPWTRPEL